MVVKTYRGLLADGGQDQIRLSTIKGKTGYRIVKFQIMGETPYAANNAEHIMKIYTKEQSSVTNTVNFTDSALLGVSILLSSSAGYLAQAPPVIIFDTKVFNQDIYITHIETASSISCNYYIELEVIPLTDQGAEYTTLKDIRTQLSIS